MTDKAQLVITALQQRIGEIVSNYETQIAILRADYTNAMEQLAQKEKALLRYWQLRRRYQELSLWESWALETAP